MFSLSSLMASKRRILLLIFVFVWTHRAPTSWGLDYQQKICGFTRYPRQCIQTLSGSHFDYQNGAVISTLVQKLRNETTTVTPDSSSPSFLSASLIKEHAHASSVGYCVKLMKMALKRIDQSMSALKDSPRRRKQDIQTWLSAVITFQSSCRDILESPSDEVVDMISRKMDHLSHLASNTLALVNRITSQQRNTTDRHLTSEEDFPPWVKAKTRKLLQSTSIKANAVVAKDGSGHYRTVSDAIKAASGKRFVIYVKAGVYREKIHTNKDGITLIGAGKYSTIIAYGASVQGGTDMPGSATFCDGFIARDIGFHNTAGPRGGQALAMDISSDHSVLYRCSIAGYQDTLFAHSLRQFYRECDIYGTIDFIFGNAAAVFQKCYIILRRPQPGAYNVILASGREDPGQNTGFSIQSSTITTASEFSPVKYSIPSYLGRPWKKYARSVIMQSKIDDAIRPRGWIEWNNNFALSTLYFAEYANSGAGASTSKRVRWPGYHVIGSSEAYKFTVTQLIGGKAWLPSTGIQFYSGLA